MSAPENSDGKTQQTEQFASKLFSSLALQLIFLFMVAVFSTGAQYLVTQRGDLSLVDIGNRLEGYESLILIDNYSFNQIESIQIAFAATKADVIEKSQAANVEVERISSKEQSIKIEKILPLRRFSARILTREPIVQASLQQLEGPLGLRILRTDRLTPPFWFELALYMIFVYLPTAVLVTYFSWRLYGIRNDLSRQKANMHARADALKEELNNAQIGIRNKIAALRRTYLFRMKKLAEENDFWRMFMQKILRENLKEGTNPKKILDMFFKSKGILTEKDLEELDEAEIDFLLKNRDTPAPRT